MDIKYHNFWPKSRYISEAVQDSVIHVATLDNRKSYADCQIASFTVTLFTIARPQNWLHYRTRHPLVIAGFLVIFSF